jgi:hypothetical protein
MNSLPEFNDVEFTTHDSYIEEFHILEETHNIIAFNWAPFSAISLSDFTGKFEKWQVVFPKVRAISKEMTDTSLEESFSCEILSFEREKLEDDEMYYSFFCELGYPDGHGYMELDFVSSRSFMFPAESPESVPKEGLRENYGA